MKTCLIYGQNGLDLDVTLNLVAFYRKLGFKTFFASKLYDADMLIVVRGVDKEINIKNFKYQIIHVYDYGGWGYDRLIYSLDHSITYVFCTSEKKREHLIEIGFPKDQVYLALPPVDTSIWMSKITKKKYNFVHVGNFKPIEDDDLQKKTV